MTRTIYKSDLHPKEVAEDMVWQVQTVLSDFSYDSGEVEHVADGLYQQRHGELKLMWTEGSKFGDSFAVSRYGHRGDKLLESMLRKIEDQHRSISHRTI